MPEPKRDIKDSVFTFLFSDIEYTKQLYLSLHPEDTDIRDEDFRLVTLENILAIGQYNDLGFQVRDKLILLVEAQSTFSPNIPLRMLMYLAKTYNEYIEEHQLSLYREKKVSIPRPELYVIYTGEKEAPDILRLSDMYEGSGSADLTVRVLRDGQPGDILSQYGGFLPGGKRAGIPVWTHRRGSYEYHPTLPGTRYLGTIPGQSEKRRLLTS